jgi:hypothetical protein
MMQSNSKFVKAWQGFNCDPNRKQKAFFMMKEEYSSLMFDSVIEIWSSGFKQVFEEDKNKERMTVPWDKHKTTSL